MSVPLSAQLKCVEREIKMRQRVYPRWVDNGKMRLDQANYEIEVMQAVLATPQEIEQKERLI